MSFVARFCARCRKERGTYAFTYKDEHGANKRNYFHNECFRKELVDIAKRRDWEQK